MPLNKGEMETIINWNMEEPTATLFTYEPRVIRYMEKTLGLKPVSENGFGGKDYVFPKKLAKLPRKPSTRVMSEEQKQASRERLMKARKNKRTVT